jgi:7-cyano-7-deazaguanine synthase
MSQENQNTIVLLSGGLDSATCFLIAKKEGFNVYTLNIDYNQRHRVELEAARKISKLYGAIEHFEFKIDLGQIGASALTDPNIAVPKNSLGNNSIPITYVPARNTIFLSIALAFAEKLQAPSIFIGANAIDYSGYPDCRDEFLRSFEVTANLGTKLGSEENKIKIFAPLVKMSKADIIQTGIALDLDYSLTISCYDPSPQGLACGACDSCLLRKKGFVDANVKDPTNYV